MLSEADFIKVGQCQVSLQCMVSLADISHLKAMSERLGGLPGVQLLVDLITAIQQGDQAELPHSPSKEGLQAMVSLSDILALKDMGDRLGGMPCVKALVDLVALLQGGTPKPAPGPVAEAHKRVAAAVPARG